MVAYRHAQAELLESDARYRSLFENNHAVMPKEARTLS